MLARDEAALGGDRRHAALVYSASVFRWAETADLRPPDGNVLLALSEIGDGSAAVVSAQSGLPLDVVYPALHRLTDRGYVLEEHRRHRLTPAGQRLVAEFDRFSADGSSTETEGTS